MLANIERIKALALLYWNKLIFYVDFRLCSTWEFLTTASRRQILTVMCLNDVCGEKPASVNGAPPTGSEERLFWGGRRFKFLIKNDEDTLINKKCARINQLYKRLQYSIKNMIFSFDFMPPVSHLHCILNAVDYMLVFLFLTWWRPITMLVVHEEQRCCYICEAMHLRIQCTRVCEYPVPYTGCGSIHWALHEVSLVLYDEGV